MKVGEKVKLLKDAVGCEAGDVCEIVDITAVRDRVVGCWIDSGLGEKTFVYADEYELVKNSETVCGFKAGDKVKCIKTEDDDGWPWPCLKPGREYTVTEIMKNLYADGKTWIGIKYKTDNGESSADATCFKKVEEPNGNCERVDRYSSTSQPLEGYSNKSLEEQFPVQDPCTLYAVHEHCPKCGSTCGCMCPRGV